MPSEWIKLCAIEWEVHLQCVLHTFPCAGSNSSPSEAAHTGGCKWLVATLDTPSLLHQPHPLWVPPGPTGLCRWWGLHKGTGWQTAHWGQGHCRGWRGSHHSKMSFDCEQQMHALTHMHKHLHKYNKAHSKSFTCLHIQRISASPSESTIWKALCVRCFLTISNSENTLMGLLALTAAGPLGVEAGSGHCSPRRTCWGRGRSYTYSGFIIITLSHSGDGVQ